MDFKYVLPKEIQDFVEDAILTEISIGCSDSQVVRIEKDKKCYFLKIMKSPLLIQEYDRLCWLQDKLPVPKIEIFLQKYENDYLITEEITGKMLCDDYYLSRPEEAFSVLKEAFSRILKVDISTCPFDVSNSYKLAYIKRNVENGLVKNIDLKDTTLKIFGSVENLLSYLEANQFTEELVFSYGDISLPNIFGNESLLMGFVDVGECGIADKWFDLAICEKSIRRNYGEEYVKKFYDILKIKRDSFKINYYLYMMELY